MALVRYEQNDVTWNIGAFMAHDPYILVLIDFLKKCNIKNPITSVFGSIPCALQGGRVAPNNIPIEQCLEVIRMYNGLGVGVRLTFSKYNIEKADLMDKTSNLILDFANKNSNLNAVIMSSDLLYDYVDGRYPNLQKISSLLKPSYETSLWKNETSDYYNDLAEKYDIVVCASHNIDNPELLKGIHHKEKIEFIANHRCRKLCQMCTAHYNAQCDLEKAILSGENTTKKEEQLSNIQKKCMELKREDVFHSSSLFSNQDVDYLIGLGFKNFKIEGRESPITTFLRDVGYYMMDDQKEYLTLIQSLLELPI